nr:hypothetical protein [Tanacetum cinerariifolium]
MKTDLQKMQHARELTKELDIVNEGLSQTDLPYKDRATLNSRQTQLEKIISNSIGSNSVGQEVLEPAYFGNVKGELRDKLELAPPPIDGEWLPKSVLMVQQRWICSTLPFGWLALLEMKGWFNRFPTILQACESIIEMLRGQYGHCVACYNEAAFHFVEASKITRTVLVVGMSTLLFSDILQYEQLYTTKTS